MAGLSQYYVTKDLHWEARHCLACSQFVIEQAESSCEEGSLVDCFKSEIVLIKVVC